MAEIDVNAFTTPFQLVKGLHRDVYPAIEPSNPALSAAGKAVLVTGAGGAIGADIARAWTIAGASAVVLVGRTRSSLEEVASELEGVKSSSKIIVETADTTNEDDVKRLFAALEKASIRINVVVHAAGDLHNVQTGQIEPSTWWLDFEANIKAPYLVAHYWMKQLGESTDGTTFVYINTIAVAIVVPGFSSYGSSKYGMSRVIEHLQLEHPNLRFFNVAPGNVLSKLTQPSFRLFAKDTGMLSGGLSLYLSTPRADYLKGCFINVNWDVEKMEQHKAEIENKQLLKMQFLKAQLGPEGHPFKGEA